jgi:hypothetical protein
MSFLNSLLGGSSGAGYQAIDMIVDQLIIEAKALEIQGLMAFTHDEGVLKRAKSRGFNILGEKLISISFK